MSGQFKAPLVCDKCNVSVYYCPCSRDRIEALRKSTLESIRIANKPRARLIPAFSYRGKAGEPDYPMVDTWTIHKSFKGRIVRGFGTTIEGAWRDYNSMLFLAKELFLNDRTRWKA
jgi:hypothetical protein